VITLAPPTQYCHPVYHGWIVHIMLMRISAIHGMLLEGDI
jgi:hypothetical protein